MRGNIPPDILTKLIWARNRKMFLIKCMNSITCRNIIVLYPFKYYVHKSPNAVLKPSTIGKIRHDFLTTTESCQANTKTIVGGNMLGWSAKYWIFATMKSGQKSLYRYSTHIVVQGKEHGCMTSSNRFKPFMK